MSDIISEIPINAIIIDHGFNKCTMREWVKYIVPGKPHYQYMIERECEK